MKCIRQVNLLSDSEDNKREIVSVKNNFAVNVDKSNYFRRTAKGISFIQLTFTAFYLLHYSLS